MTQSTQTFEIRCMPQGIEVTHIFSEIIHRLTKKGTSLHLTQHVITDLTLNLVGLCNVLLTNSPMCYAQDQNMFTKENMNIMTVLATPRISKLASTIPLKILF